MRSRRGMEKIRAPVRREEEAVSIFEELWGSKGIEESEIHGDIILCIVHDSIKESS